MSNHAYAIDAAGPYALGPRQVRRVGYGAMQLAGDGVFGPPRDRDEALHVLRAAVDSGVNHIDTAQYYGPGVVNEQCSPAWDPGWTRRRHRSHWPGCSTSHRTSCSSREPGPAHT